MKKLILFLFLVVAITKLNAQAVYQPYSYHFYQKLSGEIYNPNTRFHSSLKPFFIDDSLIVNKSDSLLNMGADSSRKSWGARKLFQEHLLDVRKDDFTVYADFLPDFQIGRDFTGKKNTYLNTRGYQIGGTVGKKFSFYTSGYENQGRFADYYRNYIDNTGIVPGQSYNRIGGKYGQGYNPDISPLTADWSYVTATISYTPIKYLNVTAGYDKTFIGDGYRSMLLSDFSSPAPFLRLTGNLGNVQYMAMWTMMEDPGANKLSYDAGFRKKGGVFHYLDWNVNNRLSIGFFDSIIWSQFDDAGNRRGFDWGYASPIIFLRPVEASSGSPDNALLGFTGKYKFTKELVAYGQFSLDEFQAKEFFSSQGSSRNKYGWQLGVRGADVFKVEGLNYLLEYNTAKPYTYSSRTRIGNYANYNEPLAHPFGANFREVVGLINYTYKRFDFSGELLYSKYGLDVAGQNYGKNIFEPYTDAVKPDGNFTTQGIRTDLVYLEGKVAYVINPKYNLRLELGGIVRRESNTLGTNNSGLITFGLRSSFRNLYSDF
ncbi:gliding motility protein RemB [Pedobacter frigidisoli]|uniref:Gliding motility protein RemB n=1 Tax=Pedobacter frigidisoli TaxID=2530455 RepID=A0A4R0NPN4_9SPHI|nr:gliding motility protein RemB [Pedobacter frigidisoli]TCD01968.1 gliding motility protein RemB [Pedobacter frigidisoli]